MRTTKKPKVFYGYWIVASAFSCTFIFSGVVVYAFGLFVKPLQEDFGWGRGEIMAAWTIYALIGAAASPFVGKIVDRYEAKKVISSGATIAGFGFVWLVLMNQLWHFYAAYTLIGIGMAAMAPIPTTAIVSNWFKKRRGLAIGIISTGSGGGGVITGPLIVGYLMPNFDWRVSYLVLALLTWVLVIPLALLVIKTKPADMGLYPDGIEPDEITATASNTLPTTSEGLTLKMALATPALWLIATSFLLSHLSHVGVFHNQVPYLQDVGVSAATIATVIGGIALLSATGKFGFGLLCDWISAKYAVAIGLSLQAAGILVLLSIGPASPPSIAWLYILTIGLGIGSWLPTMSLVTSSTFGLTSYGAIFGIVNMAQRFGSAIGPLVAGYMYDATETYRLAFIIFAGLYAIATPAALILRRPKPLSPTNTTH